jgi:hypothetical protein
MYTWVPMERWLGGQLAEPPLEEAQAELVRRWLATYGPGTQRDIGWWTGWTVAETKRALASLQAVEVALDDGTGYVLPGDLDETPATEPWVALLPALDTTTMAWKERAWYLGTLEPRLFDRAGNAGSIRGDGEVVFELLEDVGVEAHVAIEKEAAAIQEWIGSSHVIPRFRTPLELELNR